LGKNETWSSTFEIFRPERWLDSDGKFDINVGLSFPFTAGKRGLFWEMYSYVGVETFGIYAGSVFPFCQASKGSK
jgi:hypothetical protein